MNDADVSALVSKVIEGDMKAFEQFYTEFSPIIYSVLLEITNDSYEAEDLMQECFISALKNINTLKDPLKAKKWLTAIAANKGKDYLKKKKASLLSEEYEYIFDIQEEKNTSLLPEESAVLDERSEEIRDIVNSVSEDKRLCLILFYQHEMSIAEISEELGISESAVKSRLFRAREDIKEEVEKRSKKGMPLFGVAPLPLILFALNKSSQAAAASFAGSSAQTAAFAGISAASQAGIAAASTAATATTAASATASAASTTATAATGIGAKVAAMSVAQKVVAGVAAASIVTGSAVGTTVVVKNKGEANATTTAYIEEVTTAPDYGFESETVFIPAVAETESSTAELSISRNSTSAAKQSTTVAQTKETEESTVTNKTTTKSTTRANTTTQKQTATTTKAQTTTKAATTKKETATEEATTAKPTTTKAVTTEKATTTTTTTKATTTAAVTTTKSASPATVTVTVWGESSSTTKTLYFEAGETITASKIENKLSDEYGIEAIADDINITAEAGGSYTATAYE